jgi:hypothetical protein
MFRRTVVALLTLAAVGLAAPTMALARGGGHGGGFGGGAMAAARGFHGGEFGGLRDRGFHDRDFGHRRFAFGPGFYAYDYYDPYTYDDSFYYYYDGGC